MVKADEKFTKKWIEKWGKVVRRSITNYKIWNADLIEDIVQEVLLIAFQNIPNLNIQVDSNIKYHLKRFWILKGINKVLKNHFGPSRLLKPKEIINFYEKVNFIQANNYCSHSEAEEFVRIDESLRRGFLIPQIQQRDDDSGWMDFVTSLLPEINEFENWEIQDVLEFCLNQLRKRKNIHNAERDFFILSEHIESEEDQCKIAKKYDISPPRVNQILNRDLPLLTRCFCEQFGLEVILNIKCEEFMS